MDLEKNCHHSISWKKSCPWCERVIQKEFTVNHPKQFYQSVLGTFLDEMDNQPKKLLGPVALAFVIMDANGDVHVTAQGNLHAIPKELDKLKHSAEQKIKEHYAIVNADNSSESL